MALQQTIVGFEAGSAAIMLCCSFYGQLTTISDLHLESHRIERPTRRHKDRILSQHQQIFDLQGLLSYIKAELFS
jgi:hypothetical protein